MALRFRKSIKLAPGIRWNLSGSGSSFTLGPRGGSVSIGKRGTFLNTGIPGLGLYERSRLSGPTPTGAAQPRLTNATTTTMSMTCGIADDGTLTFKDASGADVPEHWVEKAKKQSKEAILGLIQRKCDEVNEQVEALGRLHHYTPDCRVQPRFVAPPFEQARPLQPEHLRPGFWDKLFRSRRERIEATNRLADERYRIELTKWEQAKARFDMQVAKRKAFVETLIYEDVQAMGEFLEESLQDIVWPRETLLAVDVLDNGARVMLDVDLPELEHMPTKLAAVPARGLKLSVKEMGATKVQRLYAEHVHGILFRLVGEVFAALPRAQTVVASGYSQRRDPATAQMRDDYLLSVRVARSAWEVNDFQHLSSIDVREALGRYDLKREMLKSGALKAVQPYVA